MLTPLQLAKIKSESPYTYEALKRIVSAINALAVAMGSDPAGQSAAPHPIGSISVVAANGLFDIAITDGSVVGKPLPVPINYFVEYANNPNFDGAIVVDLGATRNAKLFLGNQTLYWRAYSQRLFSPPSRAVAFGNPPTAVAGGGSITPPAPQPSQGSGTSPTAGLGFGISLRQQVTHSTL